MKKNSTLKRFIRRLVAFPRWLATRLVRFLTDWLRTRKWGAFAAGFPAILVAAVMIIMLSRNQNVDADNIAKSYVVDSQAALDAEEYGQAELLLRKLLVLQPNEESHKYHIAICWENLKNTTRATAIMSQIAPEKKVGYEPAHFWIAKQLSKSLVMLSPNRLKSLEHHLKAASTDTRFRSTANKQLAQLYIRQQRYDQAIKTMQSVKTRGPQYWISMANLHSRNGDRENAKQAANVALSKLDQRLSKDPRQKQLWPTYVKVAVGLRKFDEAIESLQDARTKARNKTERLSFDFMISLVNCAQFDATPKSQPKKRLELINQAMELAPNSSEVLKRLAQIVADTGESTERFQSLNSALVDGRAPLAVHFVLGTAALEKDDFQKAQTHFEIVLRNKPRHVVALNNMAWSLAHNSNPDLDQALKYANEAVRIAPKDVRFLDTRARILEMTGDAQGAIRDFETIIKSDSNNRFAYERLAQLYEKVGLGDLAKLALEKVSLIDEGRDLEQPPKVPETE